MVKKSDIDKAEHGTSKEFFSYLYFQTELCLIASTGSWSRLVHPNGSRGIDGNVLYHCPPTQ